jgi:predicted  nucleic acid-binding Zn-ribbon protein
MNNNENTIARIAEITKEIAKLESRRENNIHTLLKLEGSDHWIENGKVRYGRHTIAARTRISKIDRELERNRRRLADLTKTIA